MASIEATKTPMKSEKICRNTARPYCFLSSFSSIMSPRVFYFLSPTLVIKICSSDLEKEQSSVLEQSKWLTVRGSFIASLTGQLVQKMGLFFFFFGLSLGFIKWVMKEKAFVVILYFKKKWYLRPLIYYLHVKFTLICS